MEGFVDSLTSDREAEGHRRREDWCLQGVNHAHLAENLSQTFTEGLLYARPMFSQTLSYLRGQVTWVTSCILFS